MFRETEGLRGDKLGCPLAPSDAAQRVTTPSAGVLVTCMHMHGRDDLLELVCLLLVGCSGATADPSIASQEAHNEQQGEDGRPLAARGSRS